MNGSHLRVHGQVLAGGRHTLCPSRSLVGKARDLAVELADRPPAQQRFAFVILAGFLVGD
jgi:hypothetical protein